MRRHRRDPWHRGLRRGARERDPCRRVSARVRDHASAGRTLRKKESIAWIGGQGWSHAAPLSGGKPIFTHLLGSTLSAFDFDPETRRVAVASGSSVLHVLDPFAIAEPGRERGYKPRRELYRWIFWDTLKSPIRW